MLMVHFTVEKSIAVKIKQSLAFFNNFISLARKKYENDAYN